MLSFRSGILAFFIMLLSAYGKDELISDLEFSTGETHQNDFTTNKTPNLIIPKLQAAPPVLDGTLDDTCWKTAAEASKFSIPMEAARDIAIAQAFVVSDIATEAKEKTKVMLCYDDNFIYLAFQCYESKMDKILMTHTIHDSEVWNDDDIEVFIDPHCNGKYFQFITNATGTKAESYKLNTGWNGNWEVKTGKGKDFWTAEMAIPFKSLGLQAALTPGTVWKINLVRTEYPHQEKSSWSVVQNNFHEPLSFGNLYFSQKPSCSIESILPEKPIRPGKNSFKILVTDKIGKDIKTKLSLFSGNKLLSVITEELNAESQKEFKINCELQHEKNILAFVLADMKNEKVLDIKTATLSLSTADILEIFCPKNQVYAENNILPLSICLNLPESQLQSLMLVCKLRNGNTTIANAELSGLRTSRISFNLNIRELVVGNYSFDIKLADTKNRKIIEEKQITFSKIMGPFTELNKW